MKSMDPTPLDVNGASADALAERTSSKLNRLADSRDPASIDKAAREFEAYFVQYMMKEMRKSISHSDLFGDRHAMEIFESMFDESISNAVAEGKGIGLARQLKAYMGAETGESDPETMALGDGSISAGYPRSMALNRYSGFLDDDGDSSPRITSAFGDRVHPLSGTSDFHAGIDIAMPEGTPVYAVAPGRVVFSGTDGGYGKLVVIEHDNGYTTRYAHNSRLRVNVGDQVTTATMLAESGSSGSTTGPHLHFEVRKDGVAVDPKDVRWARLP